MLLHNAKSKQILKIVSINNDSLKTHLLKIGLQEGDIVSILEIISHGPMLLEFKSEEIALGNGYLKSIEVNPVHEKLP